MSRLLEAQQRFARLLGHLLLKIHAEGYQVTLAEGYIGDSIDKPGEDTPHLRHGNHFKRLAQDLNLFKDGVFLQKTEDWRLFGEWWEQQDAQARWGGRFTRSDGNHFSLEFDGVA